MLRGSRKSVRVDWGELGWFLVWMAMILIPVAIVSAVIVVPGLLLGEPWGVVWIFVSGSIVLVGGVIAAFVRVDGEDHNAS